MTTIQTRPSEPVSGFTIEGVVHVSRRKLANVGVFVLLIAVAFLSRMGKEWLELSLPNFHAVLAVSLFAGFYFRSPALVAGVPLAAMLLSDWCLGGYEPVVRVTVYASLLLPAVVGSLLRSKLTATRLFAGTLGCSLLFFLATNFAVWCGADWYRHDLAGLLKCFARALPFLKYTLAGDLLFTAALFGTFASATASRRVSDAAQPCAVAI